MTFEWSCGVPLCYNLIPSPLCVCSFLKKKKKKKIIILTMSNETFLFEKKNRDKIRKELWKLKQL